MASKVPPVPKAWLDRVSDDFSAEQPQREDCPDCAKAYARMVESGWTVCGIGRHFPERGCTFSSAESWRGCYGHGCMAVTCREGVVTVSGKDKKDAAPGSWH